MIDADDAERYAREIDYLRETLTADLYEPAGDLPAVMTVEAVAELLAGPTVLCVKHYERGDVIVIAHVRITEVE